ncbi:MAG: translation initiation factor [Methylotenera sp.]|nr:translation initiation factor [Oligoflexia bacterium]
MSGSFNNPFGKLAEARVKLPEQKPEEVARLKVQDEAAAVKAKKKELSNYTALIRIEKSGRGGKTVTVIDGLPKQELFLKDLCKKLKNRCGSGGTYLVEVPVRSGVPPGCGLVEIQGDHREFIRSYLAEQNIKTRG